MDKLGQAGKRRRADASVMALRGDEETVLGMRTGLFGHPTTTVLRVADERIAGACEDVKELGEIVTQVGLLTLAALVNYNLAGGPEGLARAFAKWAGIDLEALRKAALDEADEAAAEAAAEIADAEAEQRNADLEDERMSVDNEFDYSELGGEA